MESSRLQPGAGTRIARSNRRPAARSEGFCDARRRAPDGKEGSNAIRVSPPMTGRRHAFGRATCVAPQPVTRLSLEHFYY